MKTLPFLFLLVACSGTDNVDDSSSPCTQLLDDLAPCPEECPSYYYTTCGEPCDAETPDCGNSIGDGRICVDGTFACSVHAPPGGPGECTFVCDPT